MRRVNPQFVKDKLKDGANITGTFISIPHPSSVEIAALYDFDFVVLDAEHAPFSRPELENLVRAGDASGIASIIRVPSIEGGWIGTALDTGAAGVLVPLVDDAKSARQAVEQALYPPAGKRGCGPGRASHYGGKILEYIGSANGKVLVAVQIETAEGLENVEDIAAVEGVDVVFVGPGDLMVSLGAFGESGRPKLDAAFEKIAAAARKNGRVLGTFVQQPEDVAPWVERGAQFIILSSDMQVLQAGYAAVTERMPGRSGAGQ